ncbi:PadR family transcriptional regulator [Arsenicicoccus sp. oral taxon 190]|uniref:PadR family transcriptional regulator n=1 Tax=Arsenicicoccus sp. oral taxon 190 TaxID=1658671 RepID=UPI00067A1181|nr:PadR family transcriptional regulator [Arsenicicoccus sp. oral taxon 190]AKT51256.1 PadR family transcriptional regulator [Arsenicicoccus sp. oral taxon 190]
MAHQPWPSEWLRGLLTLAVLRVLGDGPTYGYAIATTLEQHGFGAIKGGTLYPLLSRLEAAGHVTTEWCQGESGPGRKYFQLTAAGSAELDQQRTLWREFATHTTTFISEGE